MSCTFYWKIFSDCWFFLTKDKFFDYSVKLLNNLQGINALLVTKETLIDQNIEGIVNKISLLFSS